MGACSFHNPGTGVSAREVHAELVSNAQANQRMRREHDEDWWCSDIGDKPEFTMVPLPVGVDPRDSFAVAAAADAMIEAEDPRVGDKHGPAACFDLGPGHDPANPSHHGFLFFGWAPE